MKILVLEENEHVTKIYKKLFDKKQILGEFVKNESEFLDKINENFDYFILENPSFENIPSNNIQDFKREGKLIILSEYIQKDESNSLIRKETRDIVEKPFAMVVILSKLDFISMKKAIVV